MSIRATLPKKVPSPISAKLLSEHIGCNSDIKCNEKNVISSVASPEEGIDGSLIFCNKTDIDQIQEVVDHTKATVIISSILVKIRTEVCLIIE